MELFGLVTNDQQDMRNTTTVQTSEFRSVTAAFLQQRKGWEILVIRNSSNLPLSCYNPTDLLDDSSSRLLNIETLKMSNAMFFHDMI